MSQAVVDELVSEFAHLDEREACQLLDELGRELPEIPPSIYADENLVPGCQSRVWLVAQLNDDQPPTISIQADSDAFVVKGLIYVVLRMYDARTPQEVLDVDYVSIFDRLGLGRLILPQRKNGLYSMVKKIRHFASQALGVTVDDSASTIDVKAKRKRTPHPTRAIEGIATEFPVLNRVLPSGHRPVFLDSGASAQKPQVVIDKEREVEEHYYANAFRGRYYFGQRVDDEIEQSREKVAGLIGAARSDEIVFTAGATMSINMVAFGWGRKHLQAGDEIVITEMEHHANMVPWQAIARQVGARLRLIPVTRDGLLDADAMQSLISDRTALVAVTSMSNVLGTINPMDRLVARAHEHGAVVLVDAAQSVPHMPTDVGESQVDFLVFSGHKLYGPSGVGVLYGRHERLREMDPFVYGGHMIQRVERQSSTWAEAPAKFEAGTPPIVQIIGLGAAVDWIQSVGLEAIAQHEHELLIAMQQRLAEIPGLTIFGPEVSQKGAIVSFAVDGVSSEDLARRLDERGICTRHGHHCAMVLHERLGVPATTRASLGVYNTMEDVEALAGALCEGIAEVRALA